MIGTFDVYYTGMTNTPTLKRGIYETWYGNACYVSGPKTKSAFDLDMAERIPISEVNASQFIRKAEPSDSPATYRY